MNTILFRNCNEWRHEKDAARKNFFCTDSRMHINSGDLVIARFSALPFYREQERDIELAGARMINNFAEHEYIADLGNWIVDLADVTPQTWVDLYSLPEKGPFILKGETNSKKFSWSTHMYAETKADAITVHSRLCEDGLIGQQKIYIRKFIPLKTYMIGLRGLPITKEFRFFFYKTTLLSGGYYWSSHVEELSEVPKASEVPAEFLSKIASIVSDNASFFVADVAQAESGEWIVIELNDGQMSGLSEIDPFEMYGNLKTCLDV